MSTGTYFGYVKLQLSQTFCHFPREFEIAGDYCSSITYTSCLLEVQCNPFTTVSVASFLYSMCSITVVGTTEKIFETKLEVYDVYVDGQVIRCKPHLSCVGTVNFADRDRFIRLEHFR